MQQTFTMATKRESEKAFPYKPPKNELKQKYSYIFANQFSLQNRYLKLVFDMLIALLLIGSLINTSLLP